MIIVKLQGGIGNQLFQYALGRNLALKNNTQLKFDVSSYEEYPLRKYELGNFNAQGNVATDEEISKFTGPLSKFTDLFRVYYKRHHIKERHFNFDPEILNISRDAYLDGYWQSEKYFKDIENIIRKEITLKNSLGPESEKISKEIQTSTSISLHVRRGDYASREHIRKIFGLCQPEYYYAALERLAKKSEERVKIFVFSDDIPWVKENLKLQFPAVFVSEIVKNDAEELMLMSKCKDHIIANSSFSWWGAWLSQNPDKTIIAPKKWFIDTRREPKDLIPNQWIRI